MPKPNPLCLNAGELRHQIQIQSASTTPDSVGQLQKTWSTVRTPWASIEAITGRELYQAGELTSQVTHVIKMRYPSGVNVVAGMRVLFAGHAYLIQAPINVGQQNVVLKLYVLELNGTE